jgi:cold-inducible RNA-binding protein
MAQEAQNNAKLFIGNISFDTDFEKLKEIFAQFGEIVDSYQPQGKGFAFITFSSEEEATKALEEMHEKEVDGRALVVNVARPREERPRGNFNRGGDRGGNRGGGDYNRGPRQY